MASHAELERQRAKARRAQEEPADAKRAREAREAWLKACAAGDAFAAEAVFKDGLVPIETADAAGSTGLCLAAHVGALELAAWLISSGAAVNVRARGARPPLVWAVRANHADVIALLLEKGADPNAADDNGFAALHFAVRRARARGGQRSESRGAHSSLRGCVSHRPALAPLRLSPAQATDGLVAPIQTLLKAGANANARTRTQITPVMRAAENNHIEAVRALLAGGADPSLTSELGFSALKLARYAGHLPLSLELSRFDAARTAELEALIAAEKVAEVEGKSEA